MPLSLRYLFYVLSTNEKYQNVSKVICVMQLERPSKPVAEQWWDVTSNGSLVLQKGAMIEEKGQSLAKWSETIDLDAAGTSGEIQCNQFVFNVSIESLAGAFHRSNLISFSPRFIVKNLLHISISIIPFFGGLHDAIRKARQLRQNMTRQDIKRRQDLAPGQAMLLFHFHNISSGLVSIYVVSQACELSTLFFLYFS